MNKSTLPYFKIPSINFNLFKRLSEFSIPIFYVNQSYIQFIEYTEDVFKNTTTIKWSLYDSFPSEGAEIDRLFFNLLSSATLLINCTRKFISDLKKKGINIKDYDKKKNDFFLENPTIEIIKELRNIHTHEKPVLLTERIVVKEEQEIRQLIYDKNTISSIFENPAGKLKEYLEKVNYEIDIIEFATEYYNTITPFYKWLNDELTNSRNK